METANEMQLEQKPKSLSWLWILITIIVTAAIIGGGGWYYMNKKATSEKSKLQSQIDDLNKQVTELKSSSSTTTPDETADWKTYTNSTYGFSVKYPNDWNVYDEQELKQPLWENNEKMRFVINDGCKTQDCEQVGFYVFKNGLMENTWSDYKIAEKQGTVTIAEKEWTKLLAPKSKRTCVGSTCVPPDQYILYYVGTNTYVASYNYINEANQKIVDKILSTFQFTPVK